MRFNKFNLLCGSVAALILAGCTSLAPNVDSHFGEAANMAKARQIVDLNASQNTKAPKGLDGVAAVEAVERYQSSFKNPPPSTNVFNIGIGGGTAK